MADPPGPRASPGLPGLLGWLVGLLLLLVAPGRASAEDILEVIELNGPVENRIDLVMTGDGYTALEADKLRQDTERVIEGVFGSTPWGAYRGAFNLYRVVTESAESGADHPSQGVYVDTYFDGQFDYLGMARLTDADTVKVMQVVAGLLPEADMVVLVLNDPAYGGSGGSVAMVSTHPDAVFILTHEMGHSLGGLADEYEDPYPGYPPGDPEPNVDLDFERALIKWSAWIQPATPLPTILADAVDDYHPVGAYEGARFLSEGIYRPAPSCLMRSLAYHFCDVCREAMVRGYYARVDPIDLETPAAGVRTLRRDQPDPAIFRVEPLGAGPEPVEVRWWLDDVAAGEGTELVLDPADLRLTPGVHLLRCEVWDPTDWVRSDPDGWLISGREWHLEVLGTMPDGGIGDGGVDPDGEMDSGIAGDGGTVPPGHGDGCGCQAGPRSGDRGGGAAGQGPGNVPATGLLVMLVLLGLVSRASREP